MAAGVALAHHRTMSTDTLTATHPTGYARDEGEARWWFGTLAVIKATGADTHGGLTVVDVTIAPGGMAPPHVHHREDETFWILEGELTMTVGDTTTVARPGDLVLGPRDVPHRFKAGPDGARLLFLLSPAGLEGLIREQSVPATARTLPQPGGAPPDLARAKEIALRYGCELLI
jgi:quercetin dioxygenase-like cupin family protein